MYTYAIHYIASLLCFNCYVQEDGWIQQLQHLKALFCEIYIYLLMVTDMS